MLSLYLCLYEGLHNQINNLNIVMIHYLCEKIDNL